MTTPGDGKPTFSDSDRQWFAALSGEKRDQDSPAAQEGRALRTALEDRRRQIEADPALAQATSDASTEQHLQTLLQRARREGVFERPGDAPPALPSAASSNVVAFPWWRRRRSLLALAASLLVGVVLVQQVSKRADYPQPPTMMGADGLQRVQATQARGAAERLADQLRQRDLRPGLYQRGSTYIVDVNLMSDQVQLAGQAFAPLGLKPATGFNRVEVSEP